MEHVEKLHQQEFQEGFTQHEFGKMIETPTAKAILLKGNEEDYRLPTESMEDLRNLKQRTREELDKLPFNEELKTKLLSSLVSIQLDTEEDSFGQFGGSGIFIRPNVIMTAAHVIRHPDTGKAGKITALAFPSNWDKVKAVYFMKVKTDDIAFIVTQNSNPDFLDLYNKDIQEGEGTFVLGMSRFKPRFTQGEEGSTLYQDILGLRGLDNDQDGKPDHYEYLLSDNRTNPGDSGGVTISSTGKIRGLLSRGSDYGPKYGSYIEPQEKIVKQYGDFIHAMTKLGVEIK